MAWLTATDLFVRVAVWTGAVTVASIAVCFAAIAVLRVNYLWRRHRMAAQLPGWREALAAGTLGEETPQLSVARRDRWHFIKLWCQMHDLVRGQSREGLKVLARVLGMSKWAHHLAAGHRLRDRLLGISALGRVGEFEGIERLVELVNHPDTVISLTAAEAYAHLIPSEALPVILQAASVRGDWPTARLMDILRETGAETTRGPLLAAIGATHGEKRKRLVPLLVCLESRDTVNAVRAMLANQDEPETVAAALPLARPDDLPLVRQAADNPEWFVRSKACQVLAEFGGPEDAALLERLLGDRAWWVRYRAAEALLRLPGLSREELRKLAASHPDRYGREMLRMWLDGIGESP